MGYKCSFLDNQEYTAQDVNDIFKRVSWGGVMFYDTQDVISDLNNAGEQLTSQGVTMEDTNSCRVVLNDGRYLISKGCCLMHDGSSITFDEDGYEITPVLGQKNYVFIQRNDMSNSIDIVVSESAGDESSVTLAEIDENGKIYDRRIYAKAKVQLGREKGIRNYTLNFYTWISDDSETVTLDLENGDFSYIIIWGVHVSAEQNSFTRVPTSKNLFELVEAENVSIGIGKYVGDVYERIMVQKDGQYLHIFLTDVVRKGDYIVDIGVI